MWFILDDDDPDQDEFDSDYDYQYGQNINIDTCRVEEIPAKEPVFNAVPKKSALKKRTGSSSQPGTPTQDNASRPLLTRQDNPPVKWVYKKLIIIIIEIALFWIIIIVMQFIIVWIQKKIVLTSINECNCCGLDCTAIVQKIVDDDEYLSNKRDIYITQLLNENTST